MLSPSESRQHPQKRENTVRHSVQDGYDYGSFIWRPLIKRYLEGNVQFDVRLALELGRSGIDGQWLAIYERPRPGHPALDGWWEEANLSLLNGGTAEGEGAVLVGVREFIQHRKVPLFGVLPCVKRLYGMHDATNLVADASKLVETTTGRGLSLPVSLIPQRLVGKNREGGTAQSFPGLNDGEVVDDVIEGGSEVVYRVSEDGTPFVLRPLNHFDPEAVLSRIRIVVLHNAIRVSIEEVGNLPLKITDVTLRPTKLQESSPQLRQIGRVLGTGSHGA